MLTFFRKEWGDHYDFSFLLTDIHSHILYGIDDGSKSPQESIEILSGLQDMGFQKFITTPHIMHEYYPNSPSSINKAHDLLGVALKNADRSFTVAAAAEYYGDEYFLDLIEGGKQLQLLSNDYILFETSMVAKSPLVNSIVFKLKTKGYRPILAHPERYLYYKKEVDIFKALNCDLQVNLLSLVGWYGPEQKKLAIYLIENDLVSFLGTDIHRSDQLKALQNLLKDRKIMKLLLSKNFKNKGLEVNLFS